MQAGCSLRFTVTSSMADCRSRIAIYRLSSETLTSTSNGSLAVRDRKHHTSQRKQIQARQGRKRAVLPSSWTAPRLKSSELHEYGFFFGHHTKSGQAHWTFFTLWAGPRTRRLSTRGCHKICCADLAALLFLLVAIASNGTLSDPNNASFTNNHDNHETNEKNCKDKISPSSASGKKIRLTIALIRIITIQQ